MLMFAKTAFFSLLPFSDTCSYTDVGGKSFKLPSELFQPLRISYGRNQNICAAALKLRQRLSAVSCRGVRARVHLVGVVGADVAECRWRRLAKQRWGMVLETIDADVFRMRDVGEQRWEGGRRADCGWGGGREVGQTLCQAVHVDLDLWVVKVFLSIAVVRVTVPAVRDKEVDLLGFHKLMLLIKQLVTFAANAWISEYQRFIPCYLSMFISSMLWYFLFLKYSLILLSIIILLSW